MAEKQPEKPKPKFNYGRQAAHGRSINSGGREKPQGSPVCLAGKTFVLTGRMPTLDREDMKALIVNHGGKVTESVTGKTTFVVLGAEDVGESKIAKVKQLKISTLSEDSLIELIVEESKKRGVDAWKWKADGAAPVDDILSFVASTVGPQPDSQTPNQTGTPNPQQPVKTAIDPSSPTAGHYFESEQLWSEKYRPQTLSDMVIRQPSVKELQDWLSNWDKNVALARQAATPKAKGEKGEGKKAEGKKSEAGKKDFKRGVLLSGPPGIGKTTSAHVVAKSLGYNVVEWNASDKRNKTAIKEVMETLVGNVCFEKYLVRPPGGAPANNGPLKSGVKNVVIMDEVDGCDRGGCAEVMRLIDITRVPIICICNDGKSQKVKSLAGHCVALNFARPQARTIAMWVADYVLKKEGCSIPLGTLELIVQKYQNDIRSVLNNVQMWCRVRPKMLHEKGSECVNQSYKDMEIGLFDAPNWFLCSKGVPMPKLNEVYHSADFVDLFIQDNYLRMEPYNVLPPPQRETDLLYKISQASNSIAKGDICSRLKFREQAFGITSSHIFFSSIQPSKIMNGKFTPAPGKWGFGFPGWLGSNSTYRKNERLLTCITKNCNSSDAYTSASKRDIRQWYFSLFRNKVVAPLAAGKTGVQEVITFMDEYKLARDDWDTLHDMSAWSSFSQNGPVNEPIVVQKDVKSAFTRLYNKTHILESAIKRVMGEVNEDEPKVDDEDEIEDETEAIMQIKAKKGGKSKQSDIKCTKISVDLNELPHQSPHQSMDVDMDGTEQEDSSVFPVTDTPTQRSLPTPAPTPKSTPAVRRPDNPPAPQRTERPKMTDEPPSKKKRTVKPKDEGKKDDDKKSPSSASQKTLDHFFKRK